MKKITLLAMSLLTALFVKAQYGVDITSQLTNPDFEDGATGWTVTGGNKIAATAANYGYNGTNFMEDWVAAPTALGDHNWYQAIDVPNGVYVVKALAHAIMQSDGSVVPSGISIYANGDAVDVTTTYTNPPKEYSVATQVTDGKLTVGFRIASGNVNWAAWDNVRVTQYTAETVDEAMVNYAKDEMAELGYIAEDLAAGKIQFALADAIAASVAKIEDVTTWEEAKALWDTLKAQVEEAKASAEAYKALQAKVEQAYEWSAMGLSVGTDEFDAAITEAENNYEEAPLNVEETLAAVTALDNAIFDFFMLNADGELEFPMTDLYVKNPTLRTNNEGWTYVPENAAAVVSSNIAEFYDKDYDMSQTIEGLPDGMYVVYVTGYYRATGNDNNVGYNAHVDGSEVITAELYANNSAVKLACLYEHDINEINENTTTSATIAGYNNYANSMAEAAICFDKGFYATNQVSAIVTGGKLTFGLRDKNHGGGSWTAFRDFKLGYRGNFPAVVLQNVLDEAEQWLTDRAGILPSTAYDELSDACLYAREYTEIGLFENEEVMEAMAAFEAVYNSVKNVEALVAQLKELTDKVENELLVLEYPGWEALYEVYDVMAPLVEEGAKVELPEGQTTEQYYQEAVATLQAAIDAYYETQVATPENPADYTHRIVLPNFAPTKNYNIPAPWVVANVQASGDVWVGTGQPDAAGDGTTGLSCLNSWSNDFTTMDVHQDIEGLPNGIYSVSAQAITQGLGEQHAYATSTTGTAVSENMTIVGWDSYEWETLQTEKVVVIDGKLRIGFASVSAGDVNGWYQVTNFKLQYYGPATDEDLKSAWESSLARANEYASILLPGDSKDVKAAIEAATPIAAEGKYADACAVLNPVVAESDSIFNAVQVFLNGNNQALIDLGASLDSEVNISSDKLLGVTMQMVSQAIHAEDATHTILPALDAKLAGYVSYATALIEAENTLATLKGVKAEDIAFVKEQVITPQVDDLTAEFRNAADCADLQAKLEKAMKRLTSALNLNLPVGDLTEDLVVNPTIEDEAATGWTVVKGTGNGPTITGQHYDGTTSNRYLDSWNPATGALNFTAYQEIVGLPDGTYQLTVAARSDGDNAWVFASPEVFPADTLTADTTKWAEATQWAMVKKYYADHGEIWYADSLAWLASDGTIEAPYFNANNGTGWGWSYDTITVEVTRHYLVIGVTANSELSRKDLFTGTWFGADDWKLELLTKAATQSAYDVTDGIENVEAIVPVKLGIYDLFGRRIDTPTAPGIYIIDGKKTLIKK